jgi:hypothetical protein
MNDISLGDLKPQLETSQEGIKIVGPFGASNIDILTRTNCTFPQKQVAMASVSVDQPSFDKLTIGKP